MSRWPWNGFFGHFWGRADSQQSDHSQQSDRPQTEGKETSVTLPPDLPRPAFYFQTLCPAVSKTCLCGRPHILIFGSRRFTYSTITHWFSGLGMWARGCCGQGRRMVTLASWVQEFQALSGEGGGFPKSICLVSQPFQPGFPPLWRTLLPLTGLAGDPLRHLAYRLSIHAPAVWLRNPLCRSEAYPSVKD